jgi:hypothetical protein
VEKEAAQERVSFLKPLLEGNGYTVIIVPSPPPKTAPVAPRAEGSEEVETTVAAAPTPPATYTIGVTDVSFNATNAIFGRLLRTSTGHVVTLSYWLQQETVSHDEVPYFEKIKTWI